MMLIKKYIFLEYNINKLIGLYFEIFNWVLFLRLVILSLKKKKVILSLIF